MPSSSVTKTRRQRKRTKKTRVDADVEGDNTRMVAYAAPLSAPLFHSAAAGWAGAAAAGLAGALLGALSAGGGRRQCELCGGTGYVESGSRCPRCRGGGTGVHADAVRVPIPVRVEDGFRTSLRSARMHSKCACNLSGT